MRKCKGMFHIMMFGLIFISLCETKSIHLETHVRRKRFFNGFALSCPPPFNDPNGDEPCPKSENTCRYDDECQHFDDVMLCCFNGCNNICMNPVQAPPVIDWPITYRAHKEPIDEEVIDLVSPNVEEHGCMFKGVSHNNGEIFKSGCRNCECIDGKVTCDVMGCFPQDLLSVDKETTGKGDHSGDGPRERSDVSSLNDDGEYDNEENNKEIDVDDRERKELQYLGEKSNSKENDKWWLKN